LGSLDWILSAMSDQRAANEHRGRQPIEQAKLTNCVRHINLGRAFGQLSARAEYRVQALRCGELSDAGSALGMARRDQCQEIWKTRTQAGMRLNDDVLLAGMGGSGCNHRPSRDCTLQCCKLCWVDGRWRHINLEIAGDDDIFRAQLAQSFSVGRGA